MTWGTQPFGSRSWGDSTGDVGLPSSGGGTVTASGSITGTGSLTGGGAAGRRGSGLITGAGALAGVATAIQVAGSVSITGRGRLYGGSTDPSLWLPDPSDTATDVPGTGSVIVSSPGADARRWPYTLIVVKRDGTQVVELPDVVLGRSVKN